MVPSCKGSHLNQFPFNRYWKSSSLSHLELNLKGVIGFGSFLSNSKTIGKWYEHLLDPTHDHYLSTFYRKSPSIKTYQSSLKHNLPFDQGIKFCSNFKVLGMRRKQCHCVCLVFLIPTVYLLCQMDSIWRRYRDMFIKPNREKIWCWLYPSVQSVRSDVAGPYDHIGVTWQMLVGW